MNLRALNAAMSYVAERGVTSVHLSLTHDAGVACAFVVLEGDK